MCHHEEDDRMSGPKIQLQKNDEEKIGWKLTGEHLFEIFCATIFLGMIGLVFYNAFLRYVLRSSFPPSEEWARFLFIYITFFGAIEAFYRKKHIAVDLFINMLAGTRRKAVECVAHVLTLGALLLLFFGGLELVAQTMDTYSVATDINMTFINGTLPIMALVSFYIRGMEFVEVLKKPASEFEKKES